MTTQDDTTQSDAYAIICPYCGHRDDDTYSFIEVLRGDEDDEAETECSECDKTFTVTMTTEVIFHARRIAPKEGDEAQDDSAPPPAPARQHDSLDRAWEGVVQSAVTRAEDAARDHLFIRGAMLCGFGVVIPLPMGVEDLMRATDAARALGFHLVSLRLAQAFEPLFGPVQVMTTEGQEGLWLDFLRARERAKP